MTAGDYVLRVFDEAPSERAQARQGWAGYLSAYPSYVIYPRELRQEGTRVAVLGHTTGSHLGLPDEEESNLTLIWLAGVREGLIVEWTLVEDSEAARARYGFRQV